MNFFDTLTFKHDIGISQFFCGSRHIQMDEYISSGVFWHMGLGSKRPQYCPYTPGNGHGLTNSGKCTFFMFSEASGDAPFSVI